MYKIVQGQKIGRKIGFPTLNLEPAQLDQNFGVYACRACFKNAECFKGILHYGVRKSTDQKTTLEVHLFDFNREVYGEEVTLEVGKKIRETRKFQTLEELKRQIEEDVKSVL